MTPMICPVTGQKVMVNPDSVEKFLKLGYTVVKETPDKKGKDKDVGKK